MMKYFNNSDIRTFDLPDFVGRTMEFRQFADMHGDKDCTVIIAYDIKTGESFVIDIAYKPTAWVAAGIEVEG